MKNWCEIATKQQQPEKKTNQISLYLSIYNEIEIKSNNQMKLRAQAIKKQE